VPRSFPGFGSLCLLEIVSALQTLRFPRFPRSIRPFSPLVLEQIVVRAGGALAVCLFVVVACEGGTLPDLLKSPQEKTTSTTENTPEEKTKEPLHPVPSTARGTTEFQSAAPPEASPAAMAKEEEDTKRIEETRLPPGRIRLIPPPGVHDFIRVAILLPLSGPHAALGNAMLHGAEMALFDLAEENFSLLPFDTSGTPTGARRAAKQALSEGVELILGPLYSASVAAVAPQARKKGVPVVAFSTDRSVAGNGVFLMGFLPRDGIERVVAFARSRGLLRFAALVPDTPYGRRATQALREAVARHGGKVVEVASFSPGSPDVSTVVRHFADYDRRHDNLEKQRQVLEERDDEVSRQALKRLEKLDTLGELPFDAVLLPAGGDRLRTVAPLLPFFDIDMPKVRLLGTTQWDDSTLGTEPALAGGWFAASPLHVRADFLKKFKETYDRYPPRLATLAYDAAALAAVLARSPGGPDFSVAALAAPNGFAGLDGIFRFKSNGVAERGLAVLEMRRSRPRVMSPAPDSF